MLMAGSSVHAQSNQDFQMVNNTGMILIDVFISPSDAADWGPDVIPKDLILDGESFNFTFADVNADKCLWDIKFTAESGVEYTMTGVNLCELTTITLTSQ